MNTTEREAVATLCLLAAFADGQKNDAERRHIRDVTDSLEVGTPALYQKVLLKQVTLEQAAGALESPETRTLAFEMAVGVCDADGVTSPAERAFLERLARALEMSDEVTHEVRQTADDIAAGPLAGTSPQVGAETLTASPDPAQPRGPDPATPDGMVLRYAVLTGALELLPQSLAAMAIVPLQVKLVYRIGQQHGYTLDSGHIREFLTVAGVGMTSQVFEGYARKLFGSVAKKALGKGGKKVAKSATGAVMSFATTYGLGQVAQLYYAGGRTLTPQQVQRAFDERLEEGKALFDQHRGAVEAQSRTVNLRDLAGLVKL